MKLIRIAGGGSVPITAVAMQHGEPKMKRIGVSPKKLKQITKRLLAVEGPAGFGMRQSRLIEARKRFNLIKSGKLTESAVAALERDYAGEFARFRQETGVRR